MISRFLIGHAYYSTNRAGCIVEKTACLYYNKNTFYTG